MRRNELHDQLKRLQSADLIRPANDHPDLEYWFKHAVTHEAIYGSLLKSTRASLHRRVAESIERAAQDDLADRDATLALHYERAGLPDKAFKYAVAAGDRAQRIYALGEAVEFYDRALAMAERLSERDPAAIQAVYASRGRAIQARGDNKAALANFQAMLAAASATGDAGLQADALNSFTTLQILANEPLAILEPSMDEALRLARVAGDPLLVARALWNLGLAYRFSDPSRGIEYLNQAYAVVRSQGSADGRMRELEGYVLNDLFITLGSKGEMHKANGYLHRAVEIFRELDHRSMLADTLGGVGLAEFSFGNPAAAREALVEGLGISEAIGNEWTTTYIVVNLGQVELDAGNLEAALDLTLRGESGAQASGFVPFLGMSQRQLACVYFELGQADLGQASALAARKSLSHGREASYWRGMSIGLAVQAALERGDRREAWMIASSMLDENDALRENIEAVSYGASSLAQAGLALGRMDDVHAFLAWFIPKVEAAGAKRYLGENLYWRGRLHAERTAFADAEADYVRARELLFQAESRIILWRVDVALADLYEATGGRQKAAEARKRAAALIAQIADGISRVDLRRSFLGRPEVAAALGGG